VKIVATPLEVGTHQGLALRRDERWHGDPQSPLVILRVSAHSRAGVSGPVHHQMSHRREARSGPPSARRGVAAMALSGSALSKPLDSLRAKDGTDLIH